MARAFANDDYILLAESAAFAVSPTTISTDQSSYNSGSTITVSYAGLPGNLHDWIAIAPAGSPNDSVLAFVFTNGQTSGTATFSAPAAGSYVARAFANDDYILLAESAAFTVACDDLGDDLDGSVQLHQRFHHHRHVRGVARQPPRLDRDRTGRFPQHLRPGVRLHERSDQRHRHFLCPGRRLLRGARVRQRRLHTARRERGVHRQRGAAATTISTDQSSYSSGSTITVTYAGLPGNMHDWIAIAPAGSPNTSVLAFVFTNGQTSGTATFSAPAAGTYVARAFAERRLHLLAGERGVHRRGATSATISTDQSSYTSGATITVTYAGLPGNAARLDRDRARRFPQHLRPGVRVHERSDQRHRHFHCPGQRLLRGARVRQRQLHTARRERDVHRQRGPSRDDLHGSVELRQRCHHHRDVRGVARQREGLDRDRTGRLPQHLRPAFVFTNGQTSGTATFTAPAAGSYVARAFANDDFILLAESAAFTVTAAPRRDDLHGSIDLCHRRHHHRHVRGVARQPERLDRDRTGRFPQHLRRRVRRSRSVRPAAPPPSLDPATASTWRARSPTTTTYCWPRARCSRCAATRAARSASSPR